VDPLQIRNWALLSYKELKNKMVLTEDDIRQFIEEVDDVDVVTREMIRFMTSYSAGAVEPRDAFTTDVFTLLSKLFNTKFNRDGSFLPSEALKVVREEVIVSKNFGGSVNSIEWAPIGRLGNIEQGIMDFDWLEKIWSVKFLRFLQANQMAGIANRIDKVIRSGGHRGTTFRRPYIGLAVEAAADPVAHALDRTIREKITAKGLLIR
jgi:hypothetical protein